VKGDYERWKALDYTSKEITQGQKY
jgi:hypothetical protein